MLYYAYTDRYGKFIENYWHVGEPLPILPSTANVLTVQADGDEREYICELWGARLPIPNKPSVVWSAPWADLILLNL